MRRWLVILAVILLVASLLTGVTQVRPGERAVVRRFGRVLEEQPRPGLWIGLPWGLDRVDRVPVHLLRRVDVGYWPDADEDGTTTPAGQLLTGDHNLVNVRIAVDYNVDEERIVDFVVNADRVDATVKRATEAVLAEWVAGQSVDTVLLRGNAVLPQVVRERAQLILDQCRIGVRLADASVALLAPPDEVKPAFDEVTRAQAAIRTRELEARQEAARRLREAQAEKFKVEQLTQSYVHERQRLAAAETARFEQRLSEYRRLRDSQPGYLRALWWEEISALFARLKAEGRVDLLDHHLAGDGLDITVVPPLPSKK
jgi:membrane protease subunit HflK